jgi:hypothetical protein
MSEPSSEEIKKAYDRMMKQRAYGAEYMKKFREERRDEYNAQRRARYAKNKAKKEADKDQQSET